MNWLILIVYTITMFGLSNMFTRTIGPFDMFFRLRLWMAVHAGRISIIFKCMACFSFITGIIASIVNWFIFPTVAITPFNMIFNGTDYWWAAMFLDGLYCSGICHMIGNFDDFIDKNTPIYEDENE